jgi:hypothetical protein
MTKSVTGGIRNMAQTYLSDYSAYTQESLFTELGNSLNSIDASKNSTVTADNYKLQVQTTEEDGYTTFNWMYSFNGVDAPEKSVAIGYKNGTLKYFVDSWSIYSIGSTDLKLTEKEAVAIALQCAGNFSYLVGSGSDAVLVSGLNVTGPKSVQLLFCDDSGANNPRCNDTLTLYPMWRIGIGLDHWYPGNVYGVYVDVWADTGEVKRVQEVFSSLPAEFVDDSIFDDSTVTLQSSPVSSSQILLSSFSTSWFGVTEVVFGVLCVAFVLSLYSRKMRLEMRGFNSRGRFPKFIVGLLCFLLLSVVFTSVSSTFVQANTRSALIFGDREFGWTGFDINSTKTSSEQQYQDTLSYELSCILGSGGYEVGNYQGEGTLEENILYQVRTREQGPVYDTNLVIYFDHGIGDNGSRYDTGDSLGAWHYSVYDNSPNGNPVFDKDIYANATTQGKTNFAFISTCMSASIHNGTYKGSPYGSSFQGINNNSLAVGMPFAWTHRTVGSPGDQSFNTAQNMSLNGYVFPDDGDYCYIGFPWGSPSLSLPVDDDFPTRMYWMWVDAFFWFAINNDISINSALDLATNMLYSSYFGSSDLCTGFTAIWGISDPFENSTMAIYGNGNIHLYYQSPPSPPPPLPPESPTVTIVASYWDAVYEGEMFLSVPFNIGGTIFYSGWDVVPIYYNFLPPAVYSVYVPECLEGTGLELCYARVGDTIYTEVPFWVDARYSTQQISAVYGFRVNVTAGEGGYVSPSGLLPFYNGSSVEIAATPNQGCIFDYWTLNEQYYSSQQTLQFVAPESGVLQAHFHVAQNFSLTVQYGAHGFASASNSSYLEGTTAVVTAYPDVGYMLDYWTVNGTNVGGGSQLLVDMDANYVVVAYFRVEGDLVDFGLAAFYGPFCQVEVDLSIDSSYVGTTGYIYPVVAGEHTLEVPSSIYVEGNWYFFDAFCIMTDFGMVLEFWEDNPAVIDIEELQSGTLYAVGYS